VIDTINLVGLQKQINTQIKNLSGGQQRRVSIAIELLNTPSILFLDEPTSGLDATSSLQVLRVLKSLRRKGHTIICTIHQPREEIFQMIDNLLLMTKGGQVG
jgi:ABC-type multidrug transport system ATPase subunit